MRGRSVEGATRPAAPADYGQSKGLEQAYQILGIGAEAGAGAEPELSRAEAILELVGSVRNDYAADKATPAKEAPGRDEVARTHKDQRESGGTEQKELVRPETNKVEPEKSLEKALEIDMER